MRHRARKSILHDLYRQYVTDQDCARFAASVMGRYTVGTLERLANAPERMTRRAATLALGLIADIGSNAALAKALADTDRGVRILAETGIQQLWHRAGSAQDRKRLKRVTELVAKKRFAEAIQLATRLINEAPNLAEAWNQRAVALFGVGRYRESVDDCQRTLQMNPHHFGAAAGMGHGMLKLGNRRAALECFRRALKLNPNLDGIRAQVVYLQRTLKSQE
jgi:tetratricopeptide (TPR) repeat protein